MSDNYIIETKNLTKIYGNIIAVNNLNLKIKEGEIFGLLGPNGAGKSTTISMLCTLLKPSKGTAKVNGYDIQKEPISVRKSIGIVFQEVTLDTLLTGRENLEVHALLYGMEKSVRESRINELLKLMNLTKRADDIVKTYSGGMKRRLEVARGLLHHPKILFLDEPTLGLDPQTRAHTWKYIREMAQKEKTTIVMTTHYMDEADMMCDRVGIIDKGKIIAIDTPQNLKKMLGTAVLNLKFKVIPDEKTILEFVGTRKYSIHDHIIRITIENVETDIVDILKKTPEIQTMEVRIPTLNDVFLHLTGRDLREDAPSNESWIETMLRYSTQR